MPSIWSCKADGVGPVAVALLAVVGTVLAGCSSPHFAPAGPGNAAPGTANPPVLSVGDYWVVSQTAMQGSRSQIVNVTLTVTSVTDIVNLGGLDFPATRLEAMQERDGTTQSVRLWQRTSDGAQLRVNNTIQSAGTTSAQYSQTDFVAPCIQHPWPMRVGATMSVDCKTPESTGPGTPGLKMHFDALVVAEEQVTVPAGTFDAFKINMTIVTQPLQGNNAPSTVQQTSWYAPAACYDVRAIQTQGGARAVVELLSYRCDKGQSAVAA